MRKLLLLIALLLIVSGCPTPGNQSKPVATVAPEITARDIEEVIIRQMQQTTQTTNYAIDGERAKLARAAARDKQKLYLSMIGILVGFCVIFICLDSFIKNGKQWLGVLAGFAIVVGSLVIPLIWPW